MTEVYAKFHENRITIAHDQTNLTTAFDFGVGWDRAPAAAASGTRCR